MLFNSECNSSWFQEAFNIPTLKKVLHNKTKIRFSASMYRYSVRISSTFLKWNLFNEIGYKGGRGGRKVIMQYFARTFHISSRSSILCSCSHLWKKLCSWSIPYQVSPFRLLEIKYEERPWIYCHNPEVYENFP